MTFKADNNRGKMSEKSENEIYANLDVIKRESFRKGWMDLEKYNKGNIIYNRVVQGDIYIYIYFREK